MDSASNAWARSGAWPAAVPGPQQGRQLIPFTLSAQARQAGAVELVVNTLHYTSQQMHQTLAEWIYDNQSHGHLDVWTPIFLCHGLCHNQACHPCKRLLIPAGCRQRLVSMYSSQLTASAVNYASSYYLLLLLLA